ncbi:hypothetical protein ACROYT_G022036 [Oculina patagonica]
MILDSPVLELSLLRPRLSVVGEERKTRASEVKNERGNEGERRNQEVRIVDKRSSNHFGRSSSCIVLSKGTSCEKSSSIWDQLRQAEESDTF